MVKKLRAAAPENLSEPLKTLAFIGLTRLEQDREKYFTFSNFGFPTFHRHFIPRQDCIAECLEKEQ
jgi:hypothetical protein